MTVQSKPGKNVGYSSMQLTSCRSHFFQKAILTMFPTVTCNTFRSLYLSSPSS